MSVKLWRLRQIWRAFKRLVFDHGIVWVIGFLLHRVFLRPLTPYFASEAARRLDQWCASKSGQIHIYVTALDWRYPYQQRPQHIGRALVARGVPLIYVTDAIGYDRILSASVQDPGFMLTPHRDLAVASCDRPVVHVLSTNAGLDDQFVELVRTRNGLIVYDYIDAMDDAVSSGKLSVERLDLHRRLIANDVPSVVIASADVLMKEVASARTTDFGLITNGVDSAPFLAAKRGDVVRSDFAAILAVGKPIIGYYGSLASWFDFELINRLAVERPQYSIVVIGPDLDGTRAYLDTKISNLFILGAMHYVDLPKHAIWFDVCLVPFILNDITSATSPLKIFEYMALGKPTVSTDLPECRKYKSVLIGGIDGGDSFSEAIDRALDKARDPSFVAMAQDEGEANSWSGKVDQLMGLITKAGQTKRLH